ncbi:hypothetical protein [Streptomyces spiralis]|uniref:hypothetical protein n=1 Tax=Streptomyces spiralis TaxID=66376 RepID=UPI0036CD49F9
MPPTVDADVTLLPKVLDSAHHGSYWTPVGQIDATDRARVNGATGQPLEDLSPVPALLEIRESA